MPADQDLQVKGHCYCGSIEFSVRIPAGEDPFFTAYCHCESCRRAHSAPLYQVACVTEAMFEITAGAELLTEFHKGPKSPVRAFCSRCGSKILNRFPNWHPERGVPVAFFPALLEESTQHDLPAKLVPTRHVSRDDTVLIPDLIRDFFDHD